MVEKISHLFAGGESELGFRLLSNLARPGKWLRRFKVIIFSGVGLDEEVVRQLKAVADTRKNVVGLGPRRRFIEVHQEERFTGLLEQGLYENVQAPQRHPSAPQIQEIDPEMGQKVCLKWVAVVLKDANGLD
ncbi:MULTISPECIES: hypothetical protein [Streptomyces]|uniref:hypothetical protein n=1 Tax=Streptomyces TaxID=1883 RepID=UPI0013C4414B|nr:hypothetical protein [Streptomyces hundungensis]